MMKDNCTKDKILLYPNNIQIAKLMEMKSFLPFLVIAIIDEKNCIISDISYGLYDAFEIADALIIMEVNPCTMMMPPLSEETKNYINILSLAQEFNVRIFSPFFEMAIPNFYNNRNLRIRKSYKSDNRLKKLAVKGNKNMMITSTTKKSNNYIVEILLQRYLLSYRIYSHILSEMPIFENNIQLEESNMDYAKLNILDGPMQGNPMLFGGLSSNLEAGKWDFIMRNKPDGTLLIIGESDTYEVIKETSDYLNDIKCKVVALLYQGDFNIWYKEFLQAKLGIPILHFDGKEIPFRLMNLIINVFL